MNALTHGSLQNKYCMADVDTEQYFWNKLEEALEDENSFSCLRRIVNNARLLSNLMEADGIISEASDTLYTLQAMNKKISMASHDRRVDNILVFVFLKMLLTLPSTTKAFKLGLIDKDGRLVRKPKTKEEEESISNLDLLMFKIRKWLAPKMPFLTSVSWLKSAGNDVRLQNHFSNTDTLCRQYMVHRINKDLSRILDKG